MLACKTPPSLKKGNVLFSYEPASYTDGTSSILKHEWHVRSIQKRKTYLSACGTRMLNVTRQAIFINLVSKVIGESWQNGRWAKYIPKALRKRFEQKSRLPPGLYTTKLQAVKFAIKQSGEEIDDIRKEMLEEQSQKEVDAWAEELRVSQKELKLLKGLRTKLSRR